MPSGALMPAKPGPSRWPNSKPRRRKATGAFSFLRSRSGSFAPATGYFRSNVPERGLDFPAHFLAARPALACFAIRKCLAILAAGLILPLANSAWLTLPIVFVAMSPLVTRCRPAARMRSSTAHRTA